MAKVVGIQIDFMENGYVVRVGFSDQVVEQHVALKPSAVIRLIKSALSVNVTEEANNAD